MKPMIIRANKEKFKDFGSKKVIDIINTKKWPFGIAIVKKVGEDIKLGYDNSNNVYYVLEGKGTCVIENKSYKVKKGDFLVYPKGTRYKHLKGLTLLAISYPRFNRKKRIHVE